MSPMTGHGVVVRVRREVCQVMRRDGEFLDCTVRGRLLDARGRLGNRVVVGDEVEWEMRAGRAVLTAVAGRRNRFCRRAARGRATEQVVAANLDRLALVASAHQPPFKPGFVDRVLAQAESCGVPATLVLNKIDLCEEGEAETLAAPYGAAGYPVHFSSAKLGYGVDDLRHACRGVRVLFLGQSGVGKSRLLNALAPGLGLKIGEINARTSKGRHTTTTAWMMRAPGELEVIDTPGMRAFALWGLDPEELAQCFPEFWPLLGHCRFSGCRHESEPGCVVRGAVEEGRLPDSRYQSYRKLRAELLQAVPRWLPSPG